MTWAVFKFGFLLIAFFWTSMVGCSDEESRPRGHNDPPIITWDSLASYGYGNTPTPRAGHSMVWTGTEIIIWGGNSDLGYLTDGSRLDLQGTSWSSISDIGSPSARYNHAAVWTGSEMIVWGGGDFSAVDTGGRYSPSLDSWQTVSTANAPSPRWAFSTIWTGSEMIVWGGFDSSEKGDGFSYDPSGDAWVEIESNGAPSARFYHSAIWTGSEMIIWGGRDLSLPPYQNSGFIYNPGLNSWTEISSIGAPSPRAEHSAVWTGSEMIVWGGHDSASTLGDGGVYDPQLDTWTSIPNDILSSRCAASSFWLGDAMILLNGSSSISSRDDACLDSGALFFPNSFEWTVCPIHNAPSQRHMHASVSIQGTSDYIIVNWGGRNATGFLDTGAILYYPLN